MTKKWSSTRSLDGQTKRQASKGSRRKAANEMYMIDYPEITKMDVRRIEKMVAPEFETGNWQAIEGE